MNECAMKRNTHLSSPKIWMTILLLVFVLLLAVADSCAVSLAQLRPALIRTVIPTIAGVFTTLPPNAQLPSEAECAMQVHRSSWEPRPDNDAANHMVPTTQQIAGLIL